MKRVPQDPSLGLLPPIKDGLQFRTEDLSTLWERIPLRLLTRIVDHEKFLIDQQSRKAAKAILKYAFDFNPLLGSISKTIK
jgi:hypothetical protein